MAKLSSEQATRLESELISIFEGNPGESYQNALGTVHQRHPDLRDVVVLSDLNYRVPKLRRSGKLPAGRRSGGRAAQAESQSQAQHPVARAYQELDEAKRAVEEAQRRYEEAQVNLRSILKESLPQDFLETLIQEQR